MPTPARARRELGLYVAAEEQYGAREIVADVVYKATAADTTDPEEYGRSFNPQFRRWGRNAAADYDSFQVRAFVENRRCFGLRYLYFKPYDVETARAETMTRILRRVDKSMKAMQAEHGYVADNDFTGYLLRVAKAIDANYFEWRPFPRAAAERTDAEGIGSAVTGMIRATERVA